MNDAAAERPRRRESDSFVGQAKTLWPVLAMCCAGYAAWEVQRAKTADTAATVAKVVDDVGMLKQTVAVQTAMLTEIKDVVKDIARGQRRRRDVNE
jgi:hypothetical protein